MLYQLTIENCPRDLLEDITDLLEDRGALSITLTDKNDEPILEPEIGTTPVWRENIIQALFDNKGYAESQLVDLQAEFPWLTGTIEELAEQDWQRASMDLFQPQQFGKNLWVCPSWITPPNPEAVNVILDPGLAFGTGAHPTTSLCLHWLARATLDNLKVVDYGSGSGILAITALKLGAACVQAIDLDAQALQATQSNAAINQIPPAQLQIGYPNTIQSNNDLLIANILLGPLQSLKNEFKRVLTPGGTLVVSGLLSEQIESLITHYTPEFTRQETQIFDSWALLCFKLV
ncbi:MAG: ribosomal protein L11 methyltransferase [Legionellales bacterium RIFCSPHIGHO2_12_FULL_42_9]|nr:MAG: ribosomal protein L11 methyltransferase [Legionellales bacterium RIFCSPHIGHO2_12_FULL_42_9]